MNTGPAVDIYGSKPGHMHEHANKGIIADLELRRHPGICLADVPFRRAAPALVVGRRSDGPSYETIKSIIFLDANANANDTMKAQD